MKKYELETNEINIHNSLTSDELGNQEYLSSIIRLISNINDNQVICIDGDWGVGKTFLVKQLIHLIKHYKEETSQLQFKLVESEKDKLINICDNYLAFYYNAWENDDHNDPFSSIIYNILNDYPQYKDQITNRFDKEEIFKEFLSILTKILSNKFLNTDLSEEKIAQIKTFNDLANEINTYEEKKKLFEKLINQILDNKRMMLVIDELDRCNPNFATKILEVVKHFYNLNNVTIIIAANNNELKSTIKQQYGQEFNAYSYLNKFYDYIITMDNSRSVEYSKKYLGFSYETYLPHEVFYAMINKYNFTLRDCNRYRILYDTAKEYIEGDKKTSFFLSIEENLIIYSIILPIIFAFKIKDINAYNECLNRKTDKLKESLYYLQEYFEKNDKKDWLKGFININKNFSDISDDEVIENIVKTFIKIYKLEGRNKLFLRAIKVSL